MPRPGDHHQLGVRQLSLEPVGARDWRVVLLAPEDEHGHAEVGEPVVGELLEVPGAVELELAAAALLIREGLPVLVEGVSLIDGLTERSRPPKAARSIAATTSSPVPGVRIASAMPCHWPSGKNPVERDRRERMPAHLSWRARPPSVLIRPA